MKQIVFALLVLIPLSGCVTRKVPVMPEAKMITLISESSVLRQKCEMVDVYTLDGAHPNNVTPLLKNEAYLSGANRYSISDVTKTRKGRPSSVVANFYKCYAGSKLMFNSQVKLLPGAQSVAPIAFSEVENNSCKVLTTHVFNEISPEGLEVELANKTYMLGGNRFHITKVIEVEAGAATSVVADIYRCKHRSVNY